MNTKRLGAGRGRLGTTQTVSRRFNFSTEDRIEKLKQITLKKSCESKCEWAVRAYTDWRNERLINFQYDPAIYFADLSDLENLTKENLNHALCRFIPEVRKKKGEGEYPGATLYQLVVALQKHLVVNKLKWRLIEGDEFEDSRTVLDNVMQERTAANIGVVKRQAGLISYEHENSLWVKGVLGEDTPNKLRNTVLFLIGINIYLRAVDEHYHLRRDTPTQKGQLKFVLNPKGVRCVAYQEDTVTKTHNGGLNDMRRDRKTVWIYPNFANPSRCAVRLIDKYLGLCPPYYKKPNFYLQSLTKPGPNQWYGEQVVGSNTIGKVVKKLMQSAGIEGFFTNHSTRRTGGTRLFRAGVQRKLVKEATGHSSDAIDKYQITSDEQREMMSKIIAGDVPNNVREVESIRVESPSAPKASEKEATIVMSNSDVECKCRKREFDVAHIGELIKGIIEGQQSSDKTVIKIEIEIAKK